LAARPGRKRDMSVFSRERRREANLEARDDVVETQLSSPGAV